MITLNFTLYRFVCDVTSFTRLFAPDTEGSRIPETASFACHWSSVPRVRAAGTVESNGSTPAFFFKKQGTDMCLNFNSTMGGLDIDGGTSVIAFRVGPSDCAGDSIPVVAKGTLDPLPFVGKPPKNYAIKLRDATGQVMGKLLFLLEVREMMEEEGVRNGLASVDRHIDSTLRAVPLNEPAGPSNGNLGVEKHNTIATTKKNSKTNNGDDGRQSQVQSQKNLGISISPPSPMMTQRNSPDVVSNQQHPTKNTTVPLSECNVNQLVGQEPSCLDIDIERIIIKNETMEMDNPVPFLLGGMYHLKTRYGGASFSTPEIECHNPKEIVYSHRVTFLEVPDISEKLRFSLWENNLQVAGFSLDPAKFRVTPGVRKEYTIPFRYYPTKQVVSLEVAVCRVGVSKKGQQQSGTEKKVREREDGANSVDRIRTGSVTQSSSVSRHGTKRFVEKTKESLDQPKVIQRTSRGVAFLFNEATLKETGGQQRKNLAKDYVLKRCFDTNARQRHWEGAMRQSSGKDVGQQERQRGTDNSEEAAYPSCLSSSDERQICYVSDREPLYAGTRVQDRRTERVNGAQTFLEQIASGNSRSSSATRQHARGLDLPRVASSHRGAAWRTTKGHGDSRRNSRDGTPLRNSSAACRFSTSDEGKERLLSDGVADGNCGRYHALRERSGSRDALFNEEKDTDLFFVNTARGQQRTGDSFSLPAGSRPSYRSSLMEEWLEWRDKRTSAQASRAGSVRSAYSRDESVDSIVSRNRAASPLPTKSFVHSAEQRPYQPQCVRRSASRRSATPGRPPLPSR